MNDPFRGIELSQYLYVRQAVRPHELGSWRCVQGDQRRRREGECCASSGQSDLRKFLHAVISIRDIGAEMRGVRGEAAEGGIAAQLHC